MTVTTDDLFVQLRLGPTPTVENPAPAEISSILTKLIMVAQARVDRYAPDAPEAIKDEAVIRMAAFLYDSGPDNITPRDHFRASGAKGLLSSWRARGIVSV